MNSPKSLLRILVFPVPFYNYVILIGRDFYMHAERDAEFVVMVVL